MKKNMVNKYNKNVVNPSKMTPSLHLLRHKNPSNKCSK